MKFKLGNIVFGYNRLYKITYVCDDGRYYLVRALLEPTTLAKWNREPASRNCRLATEMEKVLYS